MKDDKTIIDSHFLKSHEARSVRILAEYEKVNSELEKHEIASTLTFFGSARFLPKDEAENALSEAKKNNKNVKEAEVDLENAKYYEEARALSFKLTEWAHQKSKKGNQLVVATGAGPGIMEAANRGANEAGGKTIGFGIKLPHEQVNNKYITPGLSFQFYYFFMRKLFLTYMAKATIMFPGGIGTIDELSEIWTLKQTERIQSPMPIVLVGKSYWNKLINFNMLVEKKVVSQEELDMVHMSDSIEDTFNYLTKEIK